MDVRTPLEKFILSTTQGEKYPKRIGLDKDSWEMLYQQLLPLYKDKYGCPVAGEKATKAGFDSILFRGVEVINLG